MITFTINPKALLKALFLTLKISIFLTAFGAVATALLYHAMKYFGPIGVLGGMCLIAVSLIFSVCYDYYKDKV